MLRIFLLTCAVLCALMAVGLIFGWGWGVFDDRAWRQHSQAWIALSAASLAASFHPWTYALDEALDGRRSR